MQSRLGLTGTLSALTATGTTERLANQAKPASHVKGTRWRRGIVSSAPDPSRTSGMDPDKVHEIKVLLFEARIGVE